MGRSKAALKKAQSRDLVVSRKKSSSIAKLYGDAESFLENLRQGGNVDNTEVIDTLIEKGYVSEEEIVDIFAREYNIEGIANLNEYKIPKEILSLIPSKICEKHLLIPLTKIDKTLVVVFSDPSNFHIRDNLSLITGCKIQPAVASRSAVREALNRLLDKKAEVDSLFYDMDMESFGLDSDEAVDLEKEKTDASASPIISFVNLIFSDAIRLNSSDIHLENYEKGFRVRYRIDGMLYEKHSLPKEMSSAIISRIKVISHMDISEKRRPQDARLKLRMGKAELNMRVNSTPTVNGEKMVLRLLDNSALQSDMSKLGMEEDQLDMFKEALFKPQGMILMTGPTGSGKTTTIYSGLLQLNTPERNISTAEDPVEFRIHGINQVQMNPKVDLNFSAALRAFLRQDPDVILVGEIRDFETAEIAFKAAATGHMVLSTLHTNDTASTVTRLLSMGVPTYSVADNISLIVSQRLLRRLCARCRTLASDESLARLTEIGASEEELHLYKGNVYKKGKGCSRCGDLGYKGRVAVYEMMTISPMVKAGIFKGLPPMELKEQAAKHDNMRTMRQSALIKARQGLTSIEEVVRATVLS